jgi:Sec-independent protein translocase protein TatA
VIGLRGDPRKEFGSPIDRGFTIDEVVQSIIMLADMLGGWEIVLILTNVLILFGVKNLPDFGERMRRGRDRRRKALREAIEKAISDRSSQEREEVLTGRFLMWVAITLGVVCLVLVLS